MFAFHAAAVAHVLYRVPTDQEPCPLWMVSDPQVRLCGVIVTSDAFLQCYNSDL